MDLQIYITPVQAMERTGRCRKTITNWVRAGKIESVKIAPRCRMILASTLPGPKTKNAA